MCICMKTNADPKGLLFFVQNTYWSVLSWRMLRVDRISQIFKCLLLQQTPIGPKLRISKHFLSWVKKAILRDLQKLYFHQNPRQKFRNPKCYIFLFSQPKRVQDQILQKCFLTTLPLFFKRTFLCIKSLRFNINQIFSPC